MSVPSVTICIPTRNRPDRLRACLQSVLWQSWRDVEIIVSDNASTTDTAAVVHELDDPRVVVDRLEVDVGLYGNLTRCLTLGRGKYRYVLHDDDLMLPGNLERKVRFMEQHPGASFVHSGFRNLDESGLPVGPVISWPRLDRDTLQPGQDFIKESLVLGGIVCVSSVLLRSSAVAGEVFDPEDGPYTDLALWLRLALRGDVGYLPEGLSAYLVHAGSASSGYRTVKMTRGRPHATQHHADAVLRAHGRFVERAPLDPDWRQELRESLLECDRRLRLRIGMGAIVPPALRPSLKRLLRWGPGSRLYEALAVESAYVPTAVPLSRGELEGGP